MGQVENTVIEKEKEVALDGGFEWLTDHSVKYLEAGYLSKGVTPKTRIREIANRAEEILGIDGYADKFYNYMSQGFFSLGNKKGSISFELDCTFCPPIPKII